MNGNFSRSNVLITFVVIVAVMAVLIVLSSGCAREPEWKALNDRIVEEQNVTVRSRDDIPETGVVSNLEPGKLYKKNDLPDVEFAPGVTCKMYWGKGVLVNWMTMEPDASIPRRLSPVKGLWWSGMAQLTSSSMAIL